jgi:hypothetical protein
MQPSEMDSAPHAAMPEANPTPRASRRVRLGALGAAAALCLVVALFVALTHGLAGGSPASGAPAAWQTYRDPLGLFTVRLPGAWSAHADMSQETFGDRTGSASETTEIIQFSDPALGAASARFSADAAPIRTDFERHWYCQGPSHTNSSFHGLPAESPSDATWLFETANARFARFQLDVWIPGVLEPPHTSPLQLTPVPTATPLPQATVAADRTIIKTILGSFQPSNAAALTCP